MRKLSITFLAILFAIVSSAQCDGERYREFIFESLDITTDVQYGNNYDLNGNDVALLLDVYEPSGDSQELRPLVIFAHGGSFVGGSKEGADVVPICQDLAKMGFVTSSINYRLGLPLTLALQEPATEAVMRGYHDMKAAIRFFRKDIAENGNTYGIDTDEIYIGGVSAGGFITLHIAFLDDLAEVPEYLDLEQQGLTGGLEGDSGNEGYSSDFNALINIAGAVGDTAWMATGDEPLLSFHGTGDNTVPYGSEMLQMFGTFDVMEVDGSASIAEKADELELTHCFETHWMEGHVPHVSNEAYYDTTRSIISNFLSHFVCPNDIALDCDYREISVLTGVAELTSSGIYFFPNPASDQLQIELIGDQNHYVRILNLTGQIVLEERLNSRKASLDISRLAPGCYLIGQGQRPEAYQKLIIE